MIGREKTAVFLNISDTNRYADQLVNLFYVQAMQVLCEDADNIRPTGRLRIPVRFILDDFAANAYIENFDKLISVIRSRNVSVSVILQNMTQLYSMYSEAEASTILNNCDHILYLGGQDIRQQSISASVPIRRRKIFCLCRAIRRICLKKEVAANWSIR